MKHGTLSRLFTAIKRDESTAVKYRGIMYLVRRDEFRIRVLLANNEKMIRDYYRNRK